jgi:hypothetical protein
MQKTYLPCLAGAQQQFVVTDKYSKKITIEKWGKPCIWLNNQNPLDIPTLSPYQKKWIEANCIIVELDVRLYQPPEILAPIFQPRARAPIALETIEERATFPHADVDPMDFDVIDLRNDLNEQLMEGPSRIKDKGKGRAPIVLDENTVYLEDLI